jgi:cobalt-zinc-cadmium efflux system membrane fusion protein
MLMTAVLRSGVVALAKQVPTVVILGLLGGLAWWGHVNSWKIGGAAKVAGDAREEGGEDEGRTRVEVDPCTAAACGLGYVRARPTDRLRVEFPSPEDVEKAGMKTEEVTTRPVEQSVAAVGELDFDRARYAVLAPRAAGTVWHVFVRPGESVKQGQPLALVESAEVGRAKSEFLTSLVQVKTRKENVEALERATGSIPPPQLREAKAALREANIKLFNDHQALVNLGFEFAIKDVEKLTDEEAGQKLSALDVPESMRRMTHEDGMTANLLPLKAPFDGVIVSQRKVKGEAVGPTEPQFVLADLGKLSLVLNVRPDEADKLKAGDAVYFRAAGMDEDVSGKVAWVSPEVDEKTRVVVARAEIDNAGGKLRPRTFGAARVVTEQNPGALTVPNDAVQTDEGVRYVFVRLDETTFQARRVEVGVRQDRFTQIVRGVAAGETVVTTGSHALKSELFKDRIGGED